MTYNLVCLELIFTHTRCLLISFHYNKGWCTSCWFWPDDDFSRDQSMPRSSCPFCHQRLLVWQGYICLHPQRRNVTTLMVGLKMVTYAKISPKMVNPRGRDGERRRRRYLFTFPTTCVHFLVWYKVRTKKERFNSNVYASLMVVFIKCAVFCYPVAPRVNFSGEIIKYFWTLNFVLVSRDLLLGWRHPLSFGPL